MNRDRKNPQENRKVTSFVRSVYGKKDGIDYSTAGSKNSDIAAMSDFSDDEDGEVHTDRVNIGIANGGRWTDAGRKMQTDPWEGVQPADQQC